MNFYQRANLTMSLGVIIGFELSILNIFKDLQNGNVYNAIKENSIVMLWMFYQLMFRIKVLVDDHNHFADEHVSGNHQPLFNFILFVLSNFLFVIAAVLSTNMALSSIFFGFGLFLSTLWAYLDLNSTPKATVIFWLFINLLSLIPLNILYQSTDGLEAGAIATLFLFLALDYSYSETHGNMPKVNT